MAAESDSPAARVKILSVEALDTEMQERAFQAIERIERKSFPKHESLAGFMRSESRMRGRTLFMAEMEAGAVAGYLLLQCGALVAHVLKLAVAPEFRRQRVASRLLREAMDIVRQPKRSTRSAMYRPVRTMTLHVDPDRSGAVALYRGLGFVEQSRRKDYYTVGRDALLMECDLTLAREPGASH